MPKPIHRREHAVLCQLLADLRHETGLKQEELAKALRRPQPYISAIETGQRRVDLVELRDLCGALGITLPAFVREFEAVLKSTKPLPRQRRRVD